MRCCCCCLINWYNVVAGSRSRSFQLTWYWYVVWGWYCLKLYKKWIVIFHMLWENASHDQRPCDLIWLNNERLILLPIWTSILIHDQYWVTWYQWYRFYFAWLIFCVIRFEPDESLLLMWIRKMNTNWIFAHYFDEEEAVDLRRKRLWFLIRFVD